MYWINIDLVTELPQNILDAKTNKIQVSKISNSGKLRRVKYLKLKYNNCFLFKMQSKIEYLESSSDEGIFTSIIPIKS